MDFCVQNRNCSLVAIIFLDWRKKNTAGLIPQKSGESGPVSPGWTSAGVFEVLRYFGPKVCRKCYVTYEMMLIHYIYAIYAEKSKNNCVQKVC
jgi:hypothetical protein